MDTTASNAFETARLTPKLYDPATFLDRGVALPFTTPLLAGARARPSDSHRLELIILNPSGGRGVYIMPWSAMGAFCRPTMHDSMFSQRIVALPHVTPLIIRRVARQIAAEGLAGEEALAAAQVATEADKGDLILANYQLLMLLCAQNPPDPARVAVTVEGVPAQAGRLRITVEAVAARIGRSGDWAATALEQLAELMAGLGVGDGGTKARIQQQIETLAQTRAEIHRWATARQDEVMTDYGAMVCSVAELTLALAGTTLAAARALAADMAELLRLWGDEPDRIRELVGRPEWLLDGWERICAIWRRARDLPSQELALTEIAGLVPIIPKEVAQWSGAGIQVIERKIRFHRRIVLFKQDWLTGESLFDMIARNEQLRAASC